MESDLQALEMKINVSPDLYLLQTNSEMWWRLRHLLFYSSLSFRLVLFGLRNRVRIWFLHARCWTLDIDSLGRLRLCLTLIWNSSSYYLLEGLLNYCLFCCTYLNGLEKCRFRYRWTKFNSSRTIDRRWVYNWES